MPITGPAGVTALLDVYDDLVQGATDLVGAVTAIAPAAVRDIVCSAGGLASLLGGPLGPYGSPGDFPRQASDLGGILKAACPLPPPPPDIFPTQPPPPFTGGQCECATYTVNYQFERANPPLTTTGAFSRPGPISAPINGGVIPENPGRKSWGFYYGAPACGGRLFELLASGPLGEDEGAFTVTITGVSRFAGVPDDCGDLPGGEPMPPPPPGPIPTPPDSPVIPPSDPGPGGGGFVFSPRVGPIFIGPNGGINVPVVVNVGGPSLNIPVTIPVNVSLPDFTPTVVFGGGGGTPGGPPPSPPPPVCCRPEPIAGEEEEGDEGEPVGGDPPALRSRLVGVIVTSTINPETATATEIGQGGGARNLFVPRLGSLYFEVESRGGTGAASTATSQDHPVKLKTQYIEAPRDVTIKSYRAVPNPGVTMRVRGVFVASNPVPGA